MERVIGNRDQYNLRTGVLVPVRHQQVNRGITPLGSKYTLFPSIERSIVSFGVTRVLGRQQVCSKVITRVRTNFNRLASFPRNYPSVPICTFFK